MPATAPRAADGTGEVMASVDADEYVIADITVDGAWVSIQVRDAQSVRDWR